MIDNDLKQQIDRAISENKNLGALWDILRDFKLNGGDQQVALDTLQSMREGASEDYEDRILEVMDFASGWCQPSSRIWP